MKKYYIVTETNQEYNDETYYFTDGGAPIRVYEGEEGKILAENEARRLNIARYNGINLWEHGEQWDEEAFPEIFDENGDCNWDYCLKNPNEQQVDVLLSRLPIYEIYEVQSNSSIESL